MFKSIAKGGIQGINHIFFVNFVNMFFLSKIKKEYILHTPCSFHSYDILGARMLWKPKEARI
jgi:hypothetical protein